VTRADLDTFYYYQPAVQRLGVVDVKVPARLKVGYIMGAGDEIPTVLRQVGLDVAVIPARRCRPRTSASTGRSCSGFAPMIRRRMLRRIIRSCSISFRPGHLGRQYEADVGNFNGGQFTPYPATLGRGRVSVEEAPVEMLAPEDSVFHFPNQITQRDSKAGAGAGAVLHGQMDGKFTPLLASHDAGEDSLKGGLLRAQYGKGTYIYTGYAFFRQLPAGVPGAVRLYVNC